MFITKSFMFIIKSRKNKKDCAGIFKILSLAFSHLLNYLIKLNFIKYEKVIFNFNDYVNVHIYRPFICSRCRGW
ncbi:hypothetical protein Belba_0803 [Belliella baltica DSM 15883]|uniref:Uncharacterized protein n=1 Tax=Belliella baltica (strain DSM 15883 / CIP 108006 / LMG 21964 / BA134) TaxID=866536 RepID=I3Z2I3_BELBD|nr:hypothetical protein Belba_0803 [Belliella baltica DSM 15883]